MPTWVFINVALGAVWPGEHGHPGHRLCPALRQGQKVAAPIPGPALDPLSEATRGSQVQTTPHAASMLRFDDTYLFILSRTCGEAGGCRLTTMALLPVSSPGVFALSTRTKPGGSSGDQEQPVSAGGRARARVRCRCKVEADGRAGRGCAAQLCRWPASGRRAQVLGASPCRFAHGVGHLGARRAWWVVPPTRAMRADPLDFWHGYRGDLPAGCAVAACGTSVGRSRSKVDKCPVPFFFSLDRGRDKRT